MNTTRRTTLRALLACTALALLASCSHAPPAAALPPIVFVHGNGDSAALWLTTQWRFESNGWPRDKLVALDMPYPQARDDDAKPQDGRSSSDEQMRYLAAQVERVRKASGADRVVLMGNSRGGYAIRNYIRNGGGDKTVSHAILGGTPNHGVWANAGFRPGNEFNGTGPFLTALNAPQGPRGEEVTPNVRWMTIRSDNNDLYAQPDGAWIGAKGTPTNVTADGPALRGAENVVLPGRDHRETAYHAQAFAAAYRFITGRAPASESIAPEISVTLSGLVSGPGAAGPTNLPLANGQVQVYAIDAATGARRGAALWAGNIGADGRWGPLTTDSRTPLEFVVQAPGFAISHVYRPPFARSSSVVGLRAARLADADRDAASVVTLIRPRGYFGLPRDTIRMDGKDPAPGIPPGVAGVNTSKLVLREGAGRAVVAEYRSGAIEERIVGLAWPARDNHIVWLELQQ